MKKIFMTLAAVVCCIMTSCYNSDNPVDTLSKVKMADAIKLHTAPQSFYKLGTKEVLPIYVVVDNSYEVNGKTKYYDLSTITQVTTDKENDYFSVDISHLASHGYIKLVPVLDHEGFLDILDDVENSSVYDVKIERTLILKNKKGETYKQNIDLIYLPINEYDIKETIKVSELEGENKDEFLVDVLLPYKLFDWSFQRYADVIHETSENIFDSELKKDGILYIITDGKPTEKDEPNTLDYTFTRRLTGFPDLILPDGDGHLVNFHVKVELTVTD